MNIALAGFGLEGKASFDYWNDGSNEITIISEQTNTASLPTDVDCVLGDDAFAQLHDFDLIIRSPGINPGKLPYEGKVWSATNEFFEKCPAMIIGVTGTKGKGTTCSLIASILRSAGRTVHLVGNIGSPALEVLHEIEEDDIVVYELSSFQLWDIERSPEVAVVLPFEADHLDVHDSYEDYVNAKMNILRFQSEDDVSIVHASHQGKNYLPVTDALYLEYPGQDSVYVKDGWFVSESQKICLVDSLRLPGEHNIQNASAAIIAAGYGIPAEQIEDMERIYSEGLSEFDGLPHRLKFVAEKNGVKYYDDSIATTPGSALAALASFDEPKLLILGGHDKGADYSELIESCAQTATTVVAIGSNGPRIAELCRDSDVAVAEVVGSMAEIVRETADIAQPGSVVILSPAAASFDMFKNYSDRGNQFVDAVNSL